MSEDEEKRMQAIAQAAVTAAFEKIYADVGKGVIKKIIWLVGVVTIAGAIWLAGHDALTIKP